MTPKERAFKIEGILNSSLSTSEKAIKIHEQISAIAEEEDEIVSVEVIEKSFAQMRKPTFRGFRSAILLVVASNRILNIFAVNRNLLRMDYEPIIIQHNEEIKNFVRRWFKKGDFYES